MKGGNPADFPAFSRTMTQPAEGNYFAGREQDEQILSREAVDWRVAAAHAELAARYEALAAVFGAKRLRKMPIDYF
jgi:hypothetical protein